MTGSETEPSAPLKIRWFHGQDNDNYGLRRMRLRATCRIKGVWDAVEPTTEAMSDSSTTSSVDPRLKSTREKASGIITSALSDTPLRVVIDADDD